MIVDLYKLAYHLDQKGLYDEATQLEKAIKTMAERVGIKVNDLVTLADYFDSVGDHALADRFDVMAKKAAKKNKK